MSRILRDGFAALAHYPRVTDLRMSHELDLDRHLDALESEESVLADYLLAIPTVLYYPLMRAEKRLLTHLDDHGERERESDKLEAQRASADKRRTISTSIFAVSAASMGLALTIGLGQGDIYSVSDLFHNIGRSNLAMVLFILASAIWLPTALLHTALHVRAVRSHEAAQLATSLRRARPDDDDARTLLQSHREAWRREPWRIGKVLNTWVVVLVVATLVTVPLSAVPVLAWFSTAISVTTGAALSLVLLWTTRVLLWPLRNHTDRELDVPALAMSSRRSKKRKRRIAAA